MKYEIYCGDNLAILSTDMIPDNSFDACITDPPYGMGMEHWDNSVPPVELWEQVLRVLKPGAFCLSFCSPELYHRMAVNVDDAGFDIKDQIIWMVTTKMAKQNRLKPAHEPIVVAQKPLDGTIQNNFDTWGVGKINVETTRVPWDGKPPTGWIKGGSKRRAFGKDVEKAKALAKKACPIWFYDEVNEDLQGLADKLTSFGQLYQVALKIAALFMLYGVSVHCR